MFSDRKFNSLPHRKKKAKPLGRSVSDASSKKPKKSSIFNLFSKRSDPNLNSTGNLNDSASIGDSPSNKRARKPVGRSKSDIGYNLSDSSNASGGRGKGHDNKRIKIPDADELMSKPKKKTQLSPIIENPPTKTYFGAAVDTRKRLVNANPSNHNGKNDLEPTLDHESRRTQTPRPTNTFSSSLENMHSSQLPQEKPPLTKGLKIDNMVKRLSAERFSPPLHFNSPAFSYTRPNEQSPNPIVYAQVRRDENGEKSKSPHATESPLPLNPSRTLNMDAREKSPYRDIFGSDTVDYKYQAHRDTSPVHETISSKFRNKKIEAQNAVKDKYSSKSPSHQIQSKRSNGHHINNTENHQEHENRKHFEDRPVRDRSHRHSSEPPIIPNLRPSYGSMEHLANRRKLLETKIHERSFGRETNNNNVKKTYNIPITVDDGVEFVEEDDRFVDRVKPQSPPRKQWAKQPKYYPETDINDDFCADQDSLRREQERQRHKHYLQQEFRATSPPNNNVIDLGYIDQYDDSNLKNNNIIDHNFNYKYRTKNKQPDRGKHATEKLVSTNENDFKKREPEKHRSESNSSR